MSGEIVSIVELRARRQRREDRERWEAEEEKRRQFEAERSALFHRLIDGDYPTPPGAA